LFACFMVVLVTWISFASVARELRRDALTMLQTHIMMSSLIFHLVLTLVLYLISLIDLTIAHMILVHEKTTLCLDTLVMTHVIIVVIIFYVGPIFLLEGGGGSHTHLEPRHLNGPHFLHRGSRPTGSNGEVQRIVKTSSGRMVKCWIPKIYLTNPSIELSTFSHHM
jgi:hypothetical protein